MHPHRGFTFTELVVVLLVIGILSVVAIASLRNMSAFQERGEYDEVMSAVQYARKSAIARRRHVCVTAASNSLSLTISPTAPEVTGALGNGACPLASALPFPAADAGCGAANQTCLQATSVTSAPASFVFDPLGGTPSTVTLTVSGFSPITVEAETGHVR
jgi:MSHA pilin protein MshC